MKIACIFEVRPVQSAQFGHVRLGMQHKWPIRRNVAQSRASAFSSPALQPQYVRPWQDHPDLRSRCGERRWRGSRGAAGGFSQSGCGARSGALSRSRARGAERPSLPVVAAVDVA